MKTKNIIIISVAALALIAIFGYKWFNNKKEIATVVFNNLKTKIVGIRQIKITSGYLRFFLDLELFNQSNEDLQLNTFGLASISSIIVYYNDVWLGESPTNISDINIENNKSLILKNIPIEINLKNALNLLPELLFESISINKIKLKVQVAALGQNYTLDAI